MPMSACYNAWPIPTGAPTLPETTFVPEPSPVPRRSDLLVSEMTESAVLGPRDYWTSRVARALASVISDTTAGEK